MDNYTHDFLDNFHFFSHLNTTMEKALDMIELQETSGTFAIMAGKQRSGIGRKGNYWFSPDGGFYVTLGIYGFEFASNFTLFLGSIIHKVISELIPDRELLKLKWPNDLYYKDRKIAGIIVQNLSRKKYYLCGIGINTNINDFPEELNFCATSLRIQTRQNTDNLLLLNRLLDELISELPGYLDTLTFDKKYYNHNDYLINKNIILNTEFSEFKGKYMGVTSAGAILVQLENGSIQPFYAGTITL